MKKFSKALLTCAVTACLLSTSVTSAAATMYGEFKFQPFGDLSKHAAVYADKITGNYVEVATFNTDGTFDVSLLWNAGQFVKNQGKVALTAAFTGLNVSYQMYATYTASGTVASSGGKTIFTFTPNTGSLKVFVDNQMDTVFPDDPSAGFPTAGNQGFGDPLNPLHPFDGSSNDDQIVGGQPKTGMGTLDPSLPTCGSDGINCGSFGSTTEWILKSLPVPPIPYFANADSTPFSFNRSFQSGQLDNFTAIDTQTINGSLDLTFGNVVPEPATTLLFGLGLLGFGLTRRRKGL